MEVINNLEKLAGIVLEARQEAVKFESGNKSAGTRTRRLMQDIKKLAQDIRVEIQSVKQQS